MNLESIRESLSLKELQLNQRFKQLNLDFKTFISQRSDFVDASLREYLAVFVFVWGIWLSVILFTIYIVYALFYDTSYIALTSICMYELITHTDRVYEEGGRPKAWMRTAGMWVHLRNYFKHEFIITTSANEEEPVTDKPGLGMSKRRSDMSPPASPASLSLTISPRSPGSPTSTVPETPSYKPTPRGPYLVGYHPHGVAAIGTSVAFGPESAELSRLFPGVNFMGCTLGSNFHIPFLREFLLSMGGVSVSEKSIKAVLNRGPNYAAVVVPGGASEAMHAYPFSSDLTLKKRQGFFRIALECGATLIPAYCFGENELYYQPQSKLLKSIQSQMSRMMGSFFPIYLGACLVPFNPVPRRTKLITVFGEPVQVRPRPNPSLEEIEQLRDIYIKRLENIFDSFAPLLSPQSKPLRLIE